MKRDDAARWKRLTELLAPIHGAALRTARCLKGSSDEGNDLLHEAVLRAHGRLDSLRDEARFRSWFFAILLSIHRSECRRAFWRRFAPIEDLAGWEPGTERGEDDRWSARRASIALACLPAPQREAIVLHDLEGFSVEEIAQAESVTVSCVKSRLSRGRDRLRRFYIRRGWVEWTKATRSRTGQESPPTSLLVTQPEQAP
jgi:RNA polymerase sigma-70 factor (ECF subfamily)